MKITAIFKNGRRIFSLFSKLTTTGVGESNNSCLKTGNLEGEIENIPNSLHLTQFENSTRNILGMITEKELQALLFLSTYGNSSGNIIEIGSWVGKSTSFLAKGCSIRREGIVYAIDHFRGTSGKEDLYYHGLSKNENIFDRFTKNMKEIGLENYIRVFKMTSQEASKKIRNNIRLLFIDGNHEYNSVKRDIKLFEGFLDSAGIIAIHDYSVAFPDVIKAVREMIVDTGKFEKFTLAESLFVAQKK